MKLLQDFSLKNRKDQRLKPAKTKRVLEQARESRFLCGQPLEFHIQVKGFQEFALCA
jgi:hypothetical protein